MASEFDTAELSGRAAQVVAAVVERNAGFSQADRLDKYCQMVSGPMVFFRATDHLFWQDFAQDQRQHEFAGEQTRTWLQGDLHAYNFCAQHNAAGDIVYGFSDFDEAVFTNYQFDLWRMAVSIVLVARDNGDLSPAAQQRVVDAFTATYLRTLRRFRKLALLKKTHFTRSMAYGELRRFLVSVEGAYSRRGLLDHWAPVTSGKSHGLKKKPGADQSRRRFDVAARTGQLEEATDEERRLIQDAMAGYRGSVAGRLAEWDGHFTVRDVARRRSSGVASLGLRRFYVLVAGTKRDAERVLDIKRQITPAPYVHLDHMARDEYRRAFGQNDALRYATACQALTARTDPHLGWMELDDGFYSVRERSPWKEAFPTEVLSTRTDMSALASQWAEVTAIAHARANKTLAQRVDELTRGRDDEFLALVRDIAFTYADQVEHDFRAFRRALNLSPGTCDGRRYCPPPYRDLLPA